jgi:uncharacterized membrane protein HdeD (DUF308 family)
MTSFTMIVIMGVLMILGGISLLATPLITFMGAGYFIIIMFFIWGIFGIARGISDKNYDKKFFFAILSLLLGIVGLVVPGAAAMNNFAILYIAAGWFLIHGVMSIIDAIAGRKEGGDTGTMILGIALGVLELIMAVYSVAHPAVLAVGLGILIGFYFIESGVNAIIVGKATCEGGNSVTILYTVIGILTIIAGISMLATPLLTFLGTGPCIIMLFFINGVAGIARGISESRYDKSFFLAILSLILGIIGVVVPGVAAMNNSILLYMAAGWFCIRGVMTIIGAFASRREGAGTGAMVLGIVLGVIEIILGIYSIAHPAVLAVSLGILIAFYFIETGINMIFLGSAYAQATAVTAVR